MRAKVKKAKYSLKQAIMTQSGRIYLYSYFDLGAGWGMAVKATPRSFYPKERDPVPIV